MPNTDHDTALAFQRHLGECDMRNAALATWMAEAKQQRERMESKIDALIIDRAKEKAGIKMASAIIAGIAAVAGTLGGLAVKWLSR